SKVSTNFFEMRLSSGGRILIIEPKIMAGMEAARDGLRTIALVGAAFMAAGLCGCVRFHPKPLSAARTADDFDARTLNADGLRKYIEANRTTNEWPIHRWNLDALTLAAFYYHPDLDVARAKWREAKAGVTTAGERPNPSLNFTPTYDTTTRPPWILGGSLDIPIET